MADGSQKAIEAVVAGDMVRTPDAKTGLMSMARVAERLEHAADSSSAGLMVVNGALRATRNHPLLINGRVQQIEQIQVGDEIVAADGKGHAIRTRVQTVDVAPGGMNTFDLVLEGPNAAYFVNMLLVQPKLPREQER
jgi:hypothetical protein